MEVGSLVGVGEINAVLLGGLRLKNSRTAIAGLCHRTLTLSLEPSGYYVIDKLWPVHTTLRIYYRLGEDKLSYPVGRIIILSEDSPDIR